MAITEVYVDSSATGANDGTTLANTYTNLQAGIDAETLGAGGTRFNVKGTQVLTKALDITSGFSGSPAGATPFILQGLTATAGDGGQCEIDCTTNSVAFVDSTLSLIVTDCYVHSDSTGALFSPGSNSVVFRSRFESGGEGINWDTYGGYGLFINSYLKFSKVLTANAFGIIGQNNDNSNTTIFSTIVAGNTDSKAAISKCAITYGCVIDMSLCTQNSGDGLISNASRLAICNNTLIGNGVTGQDAMNVANSSGDNIIANNYFENWDDIISGSHQYTMFLGNAHYNCNNIITATGGNTVEVGTQALGASGIVGGGDYTPNSTLKALGFPLNYVQTAIASYIDIGAIQAACAGGSGVIMNRGILSGGRL